MMDKVELCTLVVSTDMGQRTKLPENADDKPRDRREPKAGPHVTQALQPGWHEYVEPKGTRQRASGALPLDLGLKFSLGQDNHLVPKAGRLLRHIPSNARIGTQTGPA